MMPSFLSEKKQSGSVIAITMLFMSFLLIGIVGAAYLLSSHLRITSLSGDYLQASYNADSALEMALYRLKHRFEGYEGGREDSWTQASPDALANTMKSIIKYHMKPGEAVTIPLNGGSRKFALFYEDTNSTTIYDLTTMQAATPLLSGTATGSTGKCFEVNIVGVYTGTGLGNGEDESISTELPCSGSPASLSSLTDPYHLTKSKPQGQPYSFSDFLNTHKRVYLLVKDISNTQKGSITLQLPQGAGSQTIAHPNITVEASGTFGSTIIQKSIVLPQNQVADITSSVLVSPN